MIIVSPAQIRAARALLDWSQDQLADRAGVSVTSVRDIENERRGGGGGEVRAGIRQALENEGVEFIPADTGGDAGPGVRLKGHPPRVLRQPRKPGAFGELQIPIEWRSREYRALVPQDVLDDLGRFPKTQIEDAYISLFDKHRRRILDAAAAAIDGGRATPDMRVYISHEDLGLR